MAVEDQAVEKPPEVEPLEANEPQRRVRLRSSTLFGKTATYVQSDFIVAKRNGAWQCGVMLIDGAPTGKLKEWPFINRRRTS